MKTFLVLLAAAATLHASPNPYHYDQFNRTHHSALFGTDRQYRVSLPASYATSGADYPVIYFFHGWSGWNPEYYDFVRIDSLVAAHDAFILVMPDGFMAPTDDGPYNVSVYCRHQQQYADYFLELTAYVDSTYRTVPERTHRGIMGHSMGGFMAYFLPWKFPHMIAGTVNNCGSAEFPVGYPDNKTLVSWRYGMANMHGVNLRMHNSTVGELHYLNLEVHQGTLREKGLTYEYAMNPGGHQIDFPGELVNFIAAVDFVQAAFAAPQPAPARWHHADMYPDFDVWDYHVDSDKDEPGFIELTDVTGGGFGVRTRKWLPHEKTIPGVTVNVTTAPVYTPHTAYTVSDYNVTRDSAGVSQAVSDDEGRITYAVNHEVHQIGIHMAGSGAEIVCIGYAVDDSSQFLVQGQQCALKLRLLNRGGTAAQGVSVALSVYEDGVAVADTVVSTVDIPAGQAVWTGAYAVTAGYDPPDNGRPFRARCNLVINDGAAGTWEDELDVSVRFDVSPFTRVEIDDGLNVSDDGVVLGTGNGDGILDPGETIMVYTRDWRTRLFHEDPYVSVQDEILYEESQPSVWPEDGLTHTSLIKIPADCPVGHRINFMGNYEIKISDTIRRMVRWGTVSLTVGQAWSSVDDKAVAALPSFTFPNPVSNGTAVSVPAGSHVTVMTNDGTVVREWSDTDTVTWNGMDAGIYVVTLENGTSVRHMTVLCTGN